MSKDCIRTGVEGVAPLKYRVMAAHAYNMTIAMALKGKEKGTDSPVFTHYQYF